MRYIKLFKESIEKLYHELKISEYIELMYKSISPIDSDLNYLKQFGFKLENNTDSIDSNGSTIVYKGIVFDNEENRIEIFRLVDDYYIMYIAFPKMPSFVNCQRVCPTKGRSYKCDTFEGVKQCLENQSDYKSYKTIKESNEIDKLYWEISGEEWQSYLPLTINPDKRTLEFLERNKFKPDINCDWGVTYYSNGEIEVNCLPDEYYVTFFDCNAYKCDTLEGLKKFYNSTCI